MQVVSSANGELQGDDVVGGQSNAPITTPADVDNTETTKYVMFRTTDTSWRHSVVVSGVRRMNKVNPHLARLVLGWVTVFRRVCHLGM